MTSAYDQGGYPTPVVKPELFPAESRCNTELPVGEVIEWFDFGQFVELFATDTSGTSHPLVITQDDAVLQASLRVREDGGAPMRPVDLAGGVPLSRAVAGDGADAFRTIGKPEEIVVDDVDDLVRTGSIVSNGSTYSLTLRGTQVEALRDGEQLVLRARAESAGVTRRVWVQLIPKVSEVKVLSVAELDELLANPKVTVNKGAADEEAIILKLEPLEVAALLAGRTVVVRGSKDSMTRLVRLRQREDVEVGFAARPAVSDYAIKDLAGFLSNPVVPGADNLPFRVPLNASIVQQLRTGISAQIDLGGERLLTLRLEEARP
jgi:hypothetical protein